MDSVQREVAYLFACAFTRLLLAVEISVAQPVSRLAAATMLRSSHRFCHDIAEGTIPYT